MLMLGHGAGGGTAAVDLQAAAQAAVGQGWTVALVEQPYRVAGRRAPPAARHLDTAWIAIAAGLRDGLSDPAHPLPLICGGRSSGARVACRTAAVTGAVAILCLAFPLVTQSRSAAGTGASRLPELEAVTVPVLIVQGEHDRFGMPPAAPGRDVVVLAGDHSLTHDPAGVGVAVGVWLAARS